MSSVLKIVVCLYCNHKHIPMIPIKESIVDVAFKKEKSIHRQLEKLRNQSPSENFWAGSHSREFHLPDHPKSDGLKVEQVGDIWRCDFLVNGRDLQEAYAIWRDYPNYYGSGDGKSMTEVLAASETEKILYTNTKFRIVLLRDEILGTTDTYWGYRIQSPVYALIDNKTNEIVVREDKAWRFKKILTGTLIEQEPKTFVDVLKLHNPFKLFIVKATETNELEHIESMLKISIDTPTRRFSDDLNRKNLWVCYILGYGTRGYDLNCTWWFLQSEDRPTNEEAIIELNDILNWYNVDSFVDMINKYREFGYDLNKLKFDDIETKWDQVHRKLIPNIKSVFNITKLEELHNVIHNIE